MYEQTTRPRTRHCISGPPHYRTQEQDAYPNHPTDIHQPTGAPAADGPVYRPNQVRIWNKSWDVSLFFPDSDRAGPDDPLSLPFFFLVALELAVAVAARFRAELCV